MPQKQRILVTGAGGFIRLRQVLGWEPSVSLEHGLKITYAWIEKELRKGTRLPALEETNAAA